MEQTIPTGWQKATLGEICSFFRGLTYSKVDEVEKSENVVLRANNIDLASYTLNFNKLKFINNNIQIKSDKIIRKNSILICTANGSKTHLGKIAFVDRDYGYAFGGFMGLLIANNSVAHPKYIFYNLITKQYRNFIKKLTDGANINNLKWSDIRIYDFLLPTISEQKRIVEKLDKIFETIDKAKFNAERNLKNSEDLFNSYLDEIFSNSDRWEEKKLDDVCEIGAGNSAPQDKALFKNGCYPFFRTSDVGKIHFGKIKQSTDMLNNRGIQGMRLFRKGTILFPKSGASTFLNHRVLMDVNGYVASHLATIYANQKILDPEFLLFFLRQIDTKQLIQDRNYPALNLSIISNIKIKFPNIIEQKRIAKKIQSMENKSNQLKQLYERKIDALSELQQAVLNKAFQGEL